MASYIQWKEVCALGTRTALMM